MIKPFRTLLLLIFLFVNRVSSQDYAWPTDASTIMTSSFGEYRTSHIHGGVDIKTWGQTGYKALAIDSGSVVLVSVSPYGYGRMVQFRTQGNLIAVYAHLSKFAPPLEKIIREEQIRKGRFALEKTLKPGTVVFRKGDLIGYTGATGTNSPHLHFELRDLENKMMNPLSLGYRIQDSQVPVLKCISISPLYYGSHVDGDFQPKLFYLRKSAKGKYKIDRPITCWGDVGLALCSFDMADGCPNRFAVYKVCLYVNERLVFTAEYDGFPYDQIREIEMERDCRLLRRGLGLFQKLYKEEGNTLTFYNPEVRNAGVLCSLADDEMESAFTRDPGRIVLKKGDHSIRIVVSDYTGNTAEAVGTLRMIPLLEATDHIPFPGIGWAGGVPGKIRIPKPELEKRFFDSFIRYRVQFDAPLPEIPRMSVWMKGAMHAMVSLVPKSSREFIGQLPLSPSLNGKMVTEVHFLSEAGAEKSMTDTAYVFYISPESGGEMVSSDGLCRVVFPPGSVFKPVCGWIRTDQDPANSSIGPGKIYSIYPDDFPLKGNVQAFINTASMKLPQNKIGVFMKQYGAFVFLGAERKGGMCSAWLRSLVPFTALADTVPPVVYSVWPGSGVHLRGKKPGIAVRFYDRLSGVSGEENYTVLLDSTRLVMEFNPKGSTAFPIQEEPLPFGKHNLDIVIRDRIGNTTMLRKTFFVDSR